MCKFNTSTLKQQLTSIILSKYVQNTKMPMLSIIKRILRFFSKENNSVVVKSDIRKA